MNFKDVLRSELVPTRYLMILLALIAILQTLRIGFRIPTHPLAAALLAPLPIIVFLFAYRAHNRAESLNVRTRAFAIALIVMIALQFVPL